MTDYEAIALLVTGETINTEPGTSTCNLGPKDLRTQGPETLEPRVLRAVLHCSSYYTLTGNLCQYYQPKRTAVTAMHIKGFICSRQYYFKLSSDSLILSVVYFQFFKARLTMNNQESRDYLHVTLTLFRPLCV